MSKHSAEPPPPHVPAPDAAAQPQPGQPADGAGALLAQLEAAQAEAAKYKDQCLRALADMDNIRRRAAREREELRRTAAASLMESLVPALDNLRLGLQSALQAHPEAQALIDGIKLIADQLRNVLIQHGLKELDPVGQAFDTQFHEAVAQQPSDKIPEGHVVQVLRPGYLLHDRLLRAASVVVSSGKK